MDAQVCNLDGDDAQWLALGFAQAYGLGKLGLSVLRSTMVETFGAGGAAASTGDFV